MPILNAYERSLECVPGTRMLIETPTQIGCRFRDPYDTGRVWTVTGGFKPLMNRPNHGARIRVVDGHNIVSFVSQQDLDLLLGQVKPGELCPWTQEKYPEIGDELEGWYGLWMDEEDVADDLHFCELDIRRDFAQEAGGYYPLPEIELRRRLHTSKNRDVQRLDILVMDYDPETGLGPDIALDTLHRRWKKVEQEDLTWRDL
jgi:hypothetical protein